MRTVLLVDDQPHIIRVIRLSLARRGYAVDVAGNGEEALSRLKNKRYDVLITDIEMPRLDGRGLCQAMHDEVKNPKPLTLVITAKPEAEVRAWTGLLPNTEFLEKPLSLRRLTARLDEYFSRGPVVGAENQ